MECADDNGQINKEEPYVTGKAVSSADSVFEIRDLLRLALHRMHSGQNESDPGDASGKNVPEGAQDGAAAGSPEKDHDEQ